MLAVRLRFGGSGIDGIIKAVAHRPTPLLPNWPTCPVMRRRAVRLRAVFGCLLALLLLAPQLHCRRPAPDTKVYRFRDPARLIPNQARFLLGVDVKAVYRSQAYVVQRRQLEHARYRQVLAVTQHCNLDLRGLEQLMLGVDQSRHFAAVLVGDGVGDLKKLTCLSESTPERAAIVPAFEQKDVGQGMFSLIAREKRKTTSIHRAGETRVEGDGTFDRFVGLRVDERTLVLCSEPWLEHVVAAAQGKGKPAVDHGLKHTYEALRKTEAVWFGGGMPKLPVGEERETGLAQIRGSVDLSHGLALRLDAGFDSVAKAQSAEATISRTLAWARSMRAMFGIPESVLDALKLARKDEELALNMELSIEQIRQLQETLSRISGGGSKAPVLPGTKRSPLEPLPTRWPSTKDPKDPN